MLAAVCNHCILSSPSKAIVCHPEEYWGGSCRRLAAEKKKQEEEVARSVADVVQARVEVAMQSPEVQARIEQRLREERARLEQQVQ